MTAPGMVNLNVPALTTGELTEEELDRRNSEDAMPDLADRGEPQTEPQPDRGEPT